MATYACVPPGAKERSGGFLGAACGARCRFRRAERQRAVAGRERSGEEAAREHLAPGGETPPGVGPIRDRNYKTHHQAPPFRSCLPHPGPVCSAIKKNVFVLGFLRPRGAVPGPVTLD